MLAEVYCKECDLIIDHGSFDFNDRITIGMYIISMIAHYHNRGHTLVKLILTLEELDMKGDFYHGQKGNHITTCKR